MVSRLGPRLHSASDIPVCLATTSDIDSQLFPVNPSVYSLKSIYEKEQLIINEILVCAKDPAIIYLKQAPTPEKLRKKKGTSSSSITQLESLTNPMFPCNSKWVKGETEPFIFI